ncbi:hypothetical protein [Undibacterium sp. TS12]|uniref:hypothetical protein n=1 Tax=Undibacterium sp. TS12 TaxID=2908202 RepID=UPI001F4CF11F|nr:hypothetical protein [Undibacterium sp. TS12]MCH8620971.1 hypothetical protein [Undibacterium sp. TS12]
MSSVIMTMNNPAVPGTPATIYTGVTASLNIALTNDTGADINLNSASNLEVFMPLYFTAAQLEQMTISNIAPAGWTFSYNSADMSLQLNWTGGSAPWYSNSAVTFTINNVLTSNTPTADAVQVNFNNIGGAGVPTQVSAALALVAPPAPGNLDLQQVLNVAPEFGGVVYVSAISNPLTNTLYLNFKNTGSTPLFNGNNMWTGSPKVSVSFVYGTTSGSLAPDDKQQSSQLGSAWAISGGIYVDQTDGWSIQNPSVTGQANSPTWTLTPNNTNKQIIGTGDQSNVTFSFSNIISMTPTGPTQMYVQFSGFMANDGTHYNDTVFVVSIIKQNPPNPGAIGIYSLAETITVNSSTEQVTIPLTWSMFGVGSVKLSFYIPGMTIPEHKYTYGTAHPALNYDTEYPQITGVTKTQTLTVYCWAYSDSNWQNQLNKIQCTVPLIFPPVINSFTIQPTTIVPPASYAFQLQWDIAGQDSFEIIADTGSGSPVKLPVPQTVTSYIVNPTAPETTYTLNVYGNTTND